jgi:protein-serine/threonine kinase
MFISSWSSLVPLGIINRTSSRRESQTQLHNHLQWTYLSNLRDLTVRFIERSGRLTERQSAYILEQVVSVIVFLHSNSIIHGDIKDENILIDDKLNIKLIDFGSSKIISYNDFQTRFQGTVNYVSPEILRGGYFSGRSNDIWCIGILLNTMLTGQVPFASINDIRILKRRTFKIKISHEANDLMNIILQADPSLRPKASAILSHDWFKKDL